jgi:hypothetical protein
MKNLKYQKRFYRDWSYPRDLFSKIVVFRESDLQILCDKPIDSDYVLARVEKYRRQIELYICKDEKFLSSLKPLAVELTAPESSGKWPQVPGKPTSAPWLRLREPSLSMSARILCAKGQKQ